MNAFLISSQKVIFPINNQIFVLSEFILLAFKRQKFESTFFCILLATRNELFSKSVVKSRIELGKEMQLIGAMDDGRLSK